MLSRITVPILAAAVLAFACGPRKPSAVASHVASTPDRAIAQASTGKGGGSTEERGRGLVSHVLVDTAQGGVRFAIEVANGSPKRVELMFPDGRTHDFIVLDGTGREVWRWSAGRMFTQGIQNRLLDKNDSVVYAERWSPPAAGRYTLVAQLRSENYPVQQRVDFALP